MPYQTKVGKLYIPCKRGDGILAQEKAACLRLFDGMCGGYIDPADWDKPPVLSDYTMGETLWIELPKTASHLNFAIEASKSINNGDTTPGVIPTTKFRRFKHFIDFVVLQPFAESQCPDFLTKVYQHKTKIPVLKFNNISWDVIKSSRDINPNGKLKADVGQITAGNYTIGPGALDNYPTFGGAGGGWAALGNLTGNLTFTLTGNITEAARATVTVNIGNFTLTNNSNYPHVGIPGNGNIITASLNDALFVLEEEGAANGSFVVRDLFIRVTGFLLDWTVFWTQNIGSQHDIWLHDLMIDNNTNFGFAFYLNDNTPNCYIYNNQIWGGKYGIRQLVAFAAAVANCTIYNVNLDGIDCDNLNAVIDNNAVYNSGNQDFIQIAGATGRNNSSSDATAADGGWGVGTNNIINRNVNIDFLSTNEADNTFLDIAPNGGLDGAGVANIVARPFGIRGRVVPGPNGTSIGAAEVPFVFTQRQSRISIPLGMGIG